MPPYPAVPIAISYARKLLIRFAIAAGVGWLRDWALRGYGIRGYASIVEIRYQKPGSVSAPVEVRFTVHNRAPFEVRVINLHLLLRERGNSSIHGFVATGHLGTVPAASTLSTGSRDANVFFAPTGDHAADWEIVGILFAFDGPLGAVVLDSGIAVRREPE